MPPEITFEHPTPNMERPDPGDLLWWLQTILFFSVPICFLGIFTFTAAGAACFVVALGSATIVRAISVATNRVIAAIEIAAHNAAVDGDRWAGR